MNKLTLLIESEFFINNLSLHINNYSDTNLHGKLYLFKVINILKKYKENKKIYNTLILIILPNNITNELYKYISYFHITDFISLDESKIIQCQQVERYLTKINLPEHTSMFYKCKCGSNSIKIREKQMRSLDEPSNIIMICNKCNNKWSSRY